MLPIDWSAFTPYTAVAGGVLIGAAAGALALGGGKIAGISGILGGVLSDALAARRPAPWRLSFVLGVLMASVLWAAALPIPGAAFAAPWPLLLIGGLLVGVGARLSSGCASGHGVCGLARLSRRSLTAVATFLSAGIATAVTVHALLH
ncbi:MAG: YeeE/YedE family protein [Thiomonas sp.]